MKSIWTLLCCVAFAASLSACKSSAPAPAEEEAVAEPEAPAEAEKQEASAQQIVTQGAKPNSIPAPPDVEAPPADAEKTASGLASKVLQKGTGDKHPSELDIVTVNYTGWTTDGRMFDSSVKRGKPAEFPLNRVIKGWTEGVQLMVTGEKRRFWIPESLAYQGRKGRPAGMLVFDVELVSFE